MEHKLLLINHEKYHLVSNFSPINNTGGGVRMYVCMYVYIYIRSDMIKNTVAKSISQFCKEKVCIYGSPSSDSDHFLNLCGLTLKYLHTVNTEFVIRGDFNINFLKDYIFKQQITLLFKSHNPFQSIFQLELVKFAVLQFIIFVDHGIINSHYISPISSGLSDHETQCLVLSNVFKYHKNKKQSFRTRITFKETITEFQSMLNIENWDEVLK